MDITKERGKERERRERKEKREREGDRKSVVKGKNVDQGGRRKI